METESPKDDVPDEIFQSSGGQKATVEPVDNEANAKNAETIEEVFAKWFDGFNRNDPEATARPSPGFLSWRQASERIALFNAQVAPDGPVPDADMFHQCHCRTRHMHTPPTPLVEHWLEDPQYFRDLEYWRARPNSSADSPQNWFAVEVLEEHLKESLGRAAQYFAKAHQPPEPIKDWVDADGRPAPSPEEVAQQRPTPEADYPITGLEGLPNGDTLNCPGGYRIVQTPDGYVAAWYGAPRRSETEAVADAWRQETQRR